MGFILGSKLLSFGNHAVNLLLGKTAFLVLDSNRLRLATVSERNEKTTRYRDKCHLRSLVGSRYLHDTVGVDFESDFNLGDTAGSGGNASELKFTEEIVILGEGTFTLKDLDENGGLVVSSSGEDLTLLSRDNGVTGDELGENPTSGLNTKGEGVDINENDIGGAWDTGQNATLDSGTISNSLIRVDSLRGFLATEELLEKLLNFGNSSGTTDKNNLKS